MISIILSELSCSITAICFFKTFAFAISTYLKKIPIIHYEGGDVTEGGALDDNIRHAITKISNTDKYQAGSKLRGHLGYICLIPKVFSQIVVGPGRVVFDANTFIETTCSVKKGFRKFHLRETYKMGDTAFATTVHPDH